MFEMIIIFIIIILVVERFFDSSLREDRSWRFK